jgi:hypothetical protein
LEERCHPQLEKPAENNLDTNDQQNPTRIESKKRGKIFQWRASWDFFGFEKFENLDGLLDIFATPF